MEKKDNDLSSQDTQLQADQIRSTSHHPLKTAPRNVTSAFQRSDPHARQTSSLLVFCCRNLSAYLPRTHLTMEDTDDSPPYRSIRATYTPTTITVYQAYPPAIAEPAVAAQKFVAPFKRSRATWIKPSFTWMAYRCGFASKPNQERVLAIEITRDGFEWALRNAALSHCESTTKASKHKQKTPEDSTAPATTTTGNESESQEQRQAEWKARMEASCVRVQWDPERDVALNRLEWRSLQVGLMGEAVERYVDEWIVSIKDVTPLMVRVGELVGKGELDEAKSLLPEERVYPLPSDVARNVSLSPPQKE
jgi:pre-mRNA-splicing factor ATP-dependent RNA helicase DHX16